jgi:hypothetical protein
VKPCKICGGSKTSHYTSWLGYGTPDHKFEMDNLLWIERQLKVKELEEKHKKLNFCQLCKQNKKSPFGICKECSEVLINRNIQEKIKQIVKATNEA